MEEQANSGPSVTEQLNAYEVGSKVYDQIFALEKNLSQTSNFFLAITGALWVAVATNVLELPSYAVVMILLLHAIASITLLQVFAGILNAISLRFKFLPAFGESYYPDMEALGKKCFLAIHGSQKSFSARYARWGRQRIFWYLIPLGGLSGSVFFLIQKLASSYAAI